MSSSHDSKPCRLLTWRRTALAAALLAGTSLGSYTVGYAALPQGDNHPASTESEAPVNPKGANVMPNTLPDFTHLVTQVKPAVVSITTKLRTSEAPDMDENQFGNMPQLPFPFNQMIPHGRSQMRAVEARGSGFIIDSDGTVVTNNHVVRNAEQVTVTLDDGTQLPAKVVGRDPRTDIAVLKVNAGQPLPYIQLGNSRDVKPGEWVVAMGNPFGLGGTVTAGIVSAVSRDIGAGPYDQFIQVDAPINQGNSGGPLFTQDGKVIGMNTAILSPSGGSIGIGFAIPSNMIRTVEAQLLKTGHVTRGYVGVEVQPLTATTAKALGTKEHSGALLAGVRSDSPAADAGLEPGDVIQAVNGQSISDPRELALNIANIKPGDEAHLTVLHDGQTKDVTVKVAEMPSEETAAATGQNEEHGRARVGLALAPLTPDLRSQLDVPANTTGAVVRSVQPGSPADSAGIQPGDVIVGVGTQKVNSPSDAVKAMQSALGGKDHALALRLMRNGTPIFVGVNVDQGQGQSQGNSDQG
jgi:serine protease Do